MKEENKEEIIKKYGENARKVLEIMERIEREKKENGNSKENEER